MRISGIIPMLPGRTTFYSANDLAATLRAKYPQKTLEYLEELLIFESRQQRTWLLASNEALYCIFDLKKEISPRVLWRLGKNEIFRNGELNLAIKTEILNSRDGRVIIGSKKPRKYSRLLFRLTPISVTIAFLLDRAFKDVAA